MAASLAAATASHCTPFTLPSNGVLQLSNSAITLTTNVVFQPQCTGALPQQVAINLGRAYPFYASAIPQIYVIAASTVIAWVLLVMLMITSRTSFTGTAGAPVGFSSGHGIIGGATGGASSIVGIGSRPWLQKVAAFTVALGLTLASAKALQTSAAQYAHSFEDANALRYAVLGSYEIRIMRLVSDIFLWLAQVQTLVRLFPRHKEKVLIKWIGFALILCDGVFASLNVALVSNTRYDGEFDDAIPALVYLFEFALGLLYAAWVIYYSLTKRRYAYYHPKMKSVALISVLSLVAVLTPVVFFVTDVSNRDIAGWGDYTRWVGAAAASVVVWEWVERIEALERDERKDGILGREVFDGDEMLEVMPNEDVIWTAPRGQRGQFRRQDKNSDPSDDGDDSQPSTLEKGFNSVTSRFRKKREPMRLHFPMGRTHSAQTAGQTTTEVGHQTVDNSNQRASISFAAFPRPPGQSGEPLVGPTPPPNVASPVSRTDTTSAASTVYVVRYHSVDDLRAGLQRQIDGGGGNMADSNRPPESQQRRTQDADPSSRITTAEDMEKETYNQHEHDASAKTNSRVLFAPWLSMANPFKRKRSALPREVEAVAAPSQEKDAQPDPQNAQAPSRWNLKARLGGSAPGTGDRLNAHNASHAQGQQVGSSVVVIPPPPRGGGSVWTPERQLSREATASADIAATSSPRGTDISSSMVGFSGTTQVQTSTQPANILNQNASPRSRTAVSQTGSESTDHQSTPSVGRQSVVSRSSDPVRPESLTPDRSGNSPVVIPAPSRAWKNRSPLATHSEASVQEEEEH